MTERILILAPRGRDAAVIEQVLHSAVITCEVCADLARLRAGLNRDVGGVLVTEEALAGADLEPLLQWCERQPAWSDLPVIVLATKQAGRRTESAATILSRLGNVMLLERPINAETLTSAARSALRARRRQYEARELLRKQEETAARLRVLNETLEQRVEERARDLEGARETLAFALDSAGMGTWDLDLLSDTARRSTQHDRIFGYDGSQSWGREVFLSRVIDEDRAAASKAFEDAEASGSLDLECRVRRQDDTVRWIVAKGRVEYDEQQRPIRMAGVVMDTTERRRTEDALRHAQKMEAIGQLTGGVAHDFNNLLTVIVGGLDMMIRHPERTERVVRLAESAMTAAKRGAQLTQQLLAFSRKQMLRPETLNPNRLLLDFADLAQRAVGGAITLEFDLDPGVDPIRVDPAQLESTVLNLIVNARDAMPEGGKITVISRNVHLSPKEAAGGRLPAGSCVMIAVKDTGSGISEETLPHVFDPFFTTKDVGKGSGLGLSQVYGFVRSAGGNVTVDSELRAGSTFKLYFPRSSDQALEEKAEGSTKVPLRRASSGETVLLVEDDEQVLRMAAESLEELNYSVVVARDAREALEHLKGPDRIDILFSDVVMPGGMNGAQLAVEAQRMRPELKVLLTSGYVGDLGTDQLIGNDVSVLSKPYRREELAQELRVILGGAKEEVPNR